MGYGCIDARGAGQAALFGRQCCLPWEPLLKSRLCSPRVVRSQHRAGQAVNSYPLGRVFASLPLSQPKHCGEMEQPDSSRLQRITGLGS